MSNTLTVVIPQLLAQAVVTLRENSITPRLVNASYTGMAAQKGNTIDIPIPSAVDVADVVPAAYAPSGTDIAPTEVSIVLDQWKEASFVLNQKELTECVDGVIPMQASEAIKAIGNYVDKKVLAEYKGVYGYVGTAGTTPFASTTADATAVRKTLNKQLAPLGDRRCIVDPDCEGAMLDLRAFQDTAYMGSDDAIKNGMIKRALGLDWYMNQNVITHVCGAEGTILTDQAAPTIGDTEIHVDGLTVKFATGDIFTVDGDDQTYTVVSCSDLTGTDADVVISPGAKVAWANSTAVTVKEDHVVNLAMHRDAIALVSRPLTTIDGLGGSKSYSMTDPISGLAIRLTVSEGYKQYRWSFDVLFGTKLIRPELACRLAG